MRTIEVGDVVMAHDVAGEGEPLVLITGLGGDVGFWRGLVPLLSDRLTVVSLDNRGAGVTRYPDDDFTVGDMADDVSALMRSLGHDRYHVLGWSMGGNVAQHLAFDRPYEVASLTLMSTYVRRPARSAFALGTLTRMVREGASKATLDMMVQSFCLTESAFRRIEDDPSPWKERDYDVRGIERQLAAIDGFDSSEYVHTIEVPTLVVHGGEDIMVPPSMGRDLASMIEGARFVTVPGEGHTMRPRSYAHLVAEHVLANGIEKGKGFVSPDDPEHVLPVEGGTVH